MKNRLFRNWIAVGVIWAGALSMTYLNLQMVRQIKIKQASVEFMQKDDIFLKTNFEKITRVLKQRASLHKPIDSLPIEMISLENRLKALAQSRDLSEFDLTSDQTIGQGDRIPLTLQVSGTFRSLVLWLQTLETDTPFLVVTGVDMAKNKEREGYRFRVGIDFRFTITDDENGSA